MTAGHVDIRTYKQFNISEASRMISGGCQSAPNKHKRDEIKAVKKTCALFT